MFKFIKTLFCLLLSFTVLTVAVDSKIATADENYILYNAPPTNKFRLPYRTAVTISTQSGVGSGFVYKREKGTSYILTAGHVCTEGRETPSSNLLWVEDSKAQIFIGKIVAYSSYPDLCSISVEKKLPVAHIAQYYVPHMGQGVYSVSSPLGVSGIALNGLMNRYAPELGDYYLVSIPAIGGVSGSALWNQGEVIGVIVASMQPSALPSFSDVAVAVTLEHVKAFIKAVEELDNEEASSSDDDSSIGK